MSKVNSDPRGMVGRIYVGNHYILQYTKYISSGPQIFPHCKSIEANDPRALRIWTQGAWFKLIWVQNVCKGYQQTTKVATTWWFSIRNTFLIDVAVIFQLCRDSLFLKNIFLQEKFTKLDTRNTYLLLLQVCQQMSLYIHDTRVELSPSSLVVMGHPVSEAVQVSLMYCPDHVRLPLVLLGHYLYCLLKSDETVNHSFLKKEIT